MTAPEAKRPRRGEEEAPAKTLQERFDEAEGRLAQVSECSDLTDQCATLLAQARQEEAAGRAMTARDLVT
jgi:hypothetical protein